MFLKWVFLCNLSCGVRIEAIVVKLRSGNVLFCSFVLGLLSSITMLNFPVIICSLKSRLSAKKNFKVSLNELKVMN